MHIQKAIILAAGRGSRLRPFTERMPKPLTTVGTQTILGKSLNAFKSNGVTDVTIVVGHLHNAIRDHVSRENYGLNVRYVMNESYASSNSMYSLYLGLIDNPGAHWVVEGDIVLDGAILNLPQRRAFLWFGDSSATGMDGAFLNTSEDGRVLGLSIARKKTDATKSSLKSIGLLGLQEEAGSRLFSWLESAVAAKQANEYYDTIVGAHLNDGMVYSVDVAGHRWCEIDEPSDLKRANTLFR